MKPINLNAENSTKRIHAALQMKVADENLSMPVHYNLYRQFILKRSTLRWVRALDFNMRITHIKSLMVL